MGSILLGFALLAASALLTYGLIRFLFPLMERYALARPNARSSHVTPTPQGAGIAVLASLVIVVALALLIMPLPGDAAWRLAGVLAAAVAMGIVGAIDDIRPLPVTPRLVAQFLGVAVVLACLGDGARVLPDWVPLNLERVLLALGMVWFINLTNFMDGIDWITVVAVIPVAIGVVFLQAFIDVETSVSLVALALGGAMLGFAPYNRYRAKLFLGDVGSLPIGLLLAWMLVSVAAAGQPTAALLLPLYYVCDATATLFRRLRKREKLAEAHRSHFYQMAVDRNGFTVPEVTANIFMLNVFLAGLACLSASMDDVVIDAICLLAGGFATAAVLRSFARGRA